MCTAAHRSALSDASADRDSLGSEAAIHGRVAYRYGCDVPKRHIEPLATLIIDDVDSWSVPRPTSSTAHTPMNIGGSGKPAPAGSKMAGPQASGPVDTGATS